jgi:hypothetical protein
MNGNRCPSAGAKIMVEGVQKTGNHLSALTGIRESQTIPPTNAAMITPIHRCAHLIDEPGAGILHAGISERVVGKPALLP